MAAAISSFPMTPPVKIRLRPVAASMRIVAEASPGGPNAKRPWWAPLFRQIPREVLPESADPAAAIEPNKAAEEERSRLTAEKARVLRREMRAMENWHDAMYHSAIASRLASPDEK